MFIGDGNNWKVMRKKVGVVVMEGRIWKDVGRKGIEGRIRKK